MRAYVPEGTARPRPVLVMFDGQNIFGDAGSFAGGWHVHKAVSRMAARPIVVGVDHGHLARIHELTPFSDGTRGGQLDATLGTLVDELLPRVRARFATTDVFIGGASLGGLAALYAHLTRPDAFAGAMAMSPSLWFTRAKLNRYLTTRARTGSRIYLDMGTRERSCPFAAQLADQLRARGHDVMWRPDPRGKHDEKTWRRRFPKALRFLLAK